MCFFLNTFQAKTSNSKFSSFVLIGLLHNRVSENLEELQRFVPRSYPREIQEKEEPRGHKIAISLGTLATAACLLAALVAYRQRERRVFKYAQVEFVFLLLLGMMLVSIAAILTAARPTNASCIMIAWLVNIGYALELVPLVVKIAAINRLMHAAIRMKRIKLSRNFLMGVVAGFTSLVGIYVMLWTVIDPPTKAGSYSLTDESTEEGSTIVSVTYFCESNSNLWMIISVGIQTFLLLCASILAFLTRKIRGDVNETNTLSFLIYWNFVCVLLRVILMMLSGSIDVSILNRSLSMILSTDSLVTIFIYFFPKFFGKELHKLGMPANLVGVGLPHSMPSDGSATNPSDFTCNKSQKLQERVVGSNRVSFSGHVLVMNPSTSGAAMKCKRESSREIKEDDSDDASDSKRIASAAFSGISNDLLPEMSNRQQSYPSDIFEKS